VRSPSGWVLACAVGASVVGLALAGCDRAAKGPGPESPTDTTTPGKRPVPPEYNTVARKYNERVELLGRLFARTVVVLKFTDEDGKRRSEQGEGFLQVVRPDKLAMSVSKVGKRLVWFGSDGQRYWWIDLVDRKKAYVGRHENYDTLRAEGVIAPGLGLRPLDLIQMLGTSPLPVDPRVAVGTTQWSSDGKRIGVTVRRPGAGGAGRKESGLMRVWLDPDTFEASKVELFDAGKTLVLVSDLSEYEHVELRNRGGNSPRVASRVLIAGPEGGPLNGSELRMSLEGLEDHRVNDDAFKFEVVLDEVGVGADDVVDLDARAPGAPGPGPKPESGGR
jgi:hypothetical protein